jgi:hypothetical protein
MVYAHVKGLPEEEFRRLTGVKRPTFEKMAAILQAKAVAARVTPKWKGGRNPGLSIEDKLLVCLEYLREYRTMFHISVSYGVSESSCWRALRWVENTLIKDGTFSLPGRKALLKSDVEYSVVVVDATETPVERPKKSRSASIRGRKNAIR